MTVYLILLLSVFILFYQSTGLGRQNFDCPDGFFLSGISSTFGGETRLYDYSCSPLTAPIIEDERCSRSNTASNLNGDMFLYCKDDEYVVGVSVLEDLKQQRWSLLCCNSPQVRVREDDCLSTSFLNAYQENFSFSSQRQIIRKFQSIYEDKEKDRRWWVQVCPIDISLGTPEGEVQTIHRYKRQLPPSLFGPDRFSKLPRIPMKKLRVVFSKSKTVRPTITRIRTSQETSQDLNEYSEENIASDNSELYYDSSYEDYSTPPPISQQKSIKRKKKKEPYDYSDYYDFLPASQRKQSNNKNSGFLGGINGFLQDLQDGLTFAEVAFGPSAPKLSAAEQQRTKEFAKADLGYSTDASTGTNSAHKTFHTDIRPPHGPPPLPPPPPPPVAANGGTLQNILEGLGLCNRVAYVRQ